jgi:hypothetical protein
MNLWTATRNRILRHPKRPESVFAPGGVERLSVQAGYREAKPFPNLVLDGLFDAAVLRAIVREFPGPGVDGIEKHDDGVYVRLKHNTTWESAFGPYTRGLLQEMTGPRVLLALERMSGISGLIGDPYLFGGGLHFTARGGKLAIHADFNRHPKLNLDRRLNLLIYLNEDWNEANQGWLELWDRDMQGAVARIAPTFNRTVIFSTTSFSFHGQPEPVLGPDGLVRRSVALYYYTNGRPDGETNAHDHSTLWQSRPDQGF